MHACPRCAGFVPDHLGICPNCDTKRSRWARLGQALLGFTGMITLAACYGGPPAIDTCMDDDGDGFFPACYDDELICDPEDIYCDCDDLNPSYNPGEVDTIGDGLDRDCDGQDGQRPGGPILPPDPTVDAAVGWADAGPTGP